MLTTGEKYSKYVDLYDYGYVASQCLEVLSKTRKSDNTEMTSKCPTPSFYPLIRLNFS